MINGLDVASPPVSLADAARDERDSRMRLDRYARDYDRARRSASPGTIARARAEWGLAIYERIQALVAYAAAEDRQNAARRGAETSRSGAASHPARQHAQDQAGRFHPGDAFPRGRARQPAAPAFRNG